MKMLRLFIAAVLIMSGTLYISAQTPVLKSAEFEKTELILRPLADSIIKGSTDQARIGACAEFNARFFDLLADPGTFDFAFDSLKTVSKIKSSDGSVRIYTWILPSRSEGTFKYYGIVQRRNPKTKEIKMTGLIELKTPTEEAEIMELKSDSWYGAVYYDIIEKKIGKSTWYFLLGWQGNDRFTTKKVIDVMYFDFWDNFTFGAPVFSDENKKLKHRVIFEYTTDAVMLLRYEKKKKMIVFDHLSPASPSQKGQYRYYGPDFTYDGYSFRKGLWTYKKNLDLRNPGERK